MGLNYLTGNQLFLRKSSEARKHIGKTIRYYKDVDVDPYRGASAFSREGLIEEVKGKNIRIGGDWMCLDNIYEAVEINN